MATTSGTSSPAQLHTYISDMLAELADMAKTVRAPRLERMIREAALEASIGGAGKPSETPRGTDR